jgi:hypothetical protein
MPPLAQITDEDRAIVEEACRTNAVAQRRIDQAAHWQRTADRSLASGAPGIHG